MDKELSELFELVKRAADGAANSPVEEDQCLDALKQLKKFPVNYQVLVSTQHMEPSTCLQLINHLLSKRHAVLQCNHILKVVLTLVSWCKSNYPFAQPVSFSPFVETLWQVGKCLCQLTKHRSDKINALATDVVEIWKSIIVKETMENKKNGNGENGDSMKTESPRSEANEAKNLLRTNSMKSDQTCASKKLKVENSDKCIKSGTSSSDKIEKVPVQTTKNATEEVKMEKVSSGARKPPSVNPTSIAKLSSLVYCKDPLRDKVREILAVALCKVSSYVDDDDDGMKRIVDKHDPYRVAVQVESAMFEKWGKSNGTHKFKYRSVMLNIKHQNNPDFRRKVLIGEFEPLEILELTPEQMASDERQVENEKIKQKVLFNSERAAAPKASTNEFRCGRCKKKETTYYQMQTRSADEPMTTFVTCVNCGNHWKFC